MNKNTFIEFLIEAFWTVLLGGMWFYTILGIFGFWG